jgi:hypothetical protein
MSGEFDIDELVNRSATVWRSRQPCERMLEDMLRPTERADRGRLESEPSAMR